MPLPALEAPASESSQAPRTYPAIFSTLARLEGLVSRASQVELARQVRSAVLERAIEVIEAPTGTGKTLGYLAGAIDAQSRLPEPLPIVISTATVSLQEQILREEIPRLAKAGIIDASQVAVAKGRGRYFCPRTAALLEQKKASDSQYDLFDGEKDVAAAGVPIALDMLRAWREKEWDGQKDTWQGQIPACWDDYCGASAETCVNRACEFFAECPYMLSRQKLATAKIIIANHDIVLADLTQRAENSGSHVLPPKDYALIIDEAHTLPDKAVSKMMTRADLSQTDWLRKLEHFNESCLSTVTVRKAMERQTGFGMDVLTVGAAQLIAELQIVQELCAGLPFDDNGVYSWGLDNPDVLMLGQVQQANVLAGKINAALHVVSKAFSDFGDEAGGADRAFAVRMIAQARGFERHAQDLASALELFCSDEALVRWIKRHKDDTISLHTQPLEGRDVLEKILWSREQPIILVSATLQIAGSFERYRDKTGLPQKAHCLALPPVFDYSRGYLHQPNMQTSPGDPAHPRELVQKLYQLYKEEIALGTLVLFTSRRTMRETVQNLPAPMLDRVLMQGTRPVPELVAEHKTRIARGERSVLVGLDSMSEGLDLPGNNCGHVIITRLPFAVPGDPVEEARREHLGRDWFGHAYLADMLTMLIQSTGRLIRRESDHGVITVLDRRLWTKRYAIAAYAALPQYSRGDRLEGYFNLLAERGLQTGASVVRPRPAHLQLVASQIEPAAIGQGGAPRLCLAPMQPVQSAG